MPLLKKPKLPDAPKVRASSILPLKDYFASLGYLALLLGSCITILPRSTDYFYSTAGIERPAPAQVSSADRPEHPFLTPITAQPAATAAWCVGGVAVTMAWWGMKMARWWGEVAVGQVSLLGSDGG